MVKEFKKLDEKFKNIDYVIKFINEYGLSNNRYFRSIVLYSLSKNGYDDFNTMSSFIDFNINYYNSVDEFVLNNDKIELGIFIVSNYYELLKRNTDDSYELLKISKKYEEIYLKNIETKKFVKEYL